MNYETRENINYRNAPRLDLVKADKKSQELGPKFGFARAKKALGQNFLKSEIALRKIVEAGEIKKGDVILEIGPGRGALTEKILEKSGIVIAVEKDRELFEFLKIKFEKKILEKKLILINEDILQFEITNYELRNYKIIANIPYNITGAILKKFLTAKNQPTLMALMVQYEVAKRIIGNGPAYAKASTGKKESLLSISVKAYGEPKMIMKVGARYFSPSPKVDSAIISIKNISRKNFILNSPVPEYSLEGCGIFPSLSGRVREGLSTPSRKRVTPQEGNMEAKFWEIVKAGFAHKRKKLSSNLKTLQKNGRLASVFLASLGDKRAEDLTLADWIKLARQ